MTDPTDRMNSLFDAVDDMENDVVAVQELAEALVLMADGNRGDGWPSVARVAMAVVEHAETLKTKRKQLFDALNPHTRAAA